MGLVAALVNVGISLGIPLGVLIYLLVKKRAYLKFFLFGICGFLVSQILIRLPLLSLIQDTSSYQEFYALYPLLVLFLVALSAGLFEEPARFFFLRLAPKKEFDSKIPIFYGFGHGGIEAAVLVGVNNLILLFTQQDLLVSLNWEVFLASFERISTLMIHISLSYIVYLGVMKRKLRYLFLAVLLHTCVNFSIVWMQLGISNLAFELILMIEAFILVIFALMMNKDRVDRKKTAD